MSKNDGGPAFPGIYDTSFADMSFHAGMSLRDHFAGMAMSGNLARLNPGSIDPSFAQHLAEQAYLVADAMLAEREKRDDESR